MAIVVKTMNTIQWWCQCTYFIQIQTIYSIRFSIFFLNDASETNSFFGHLNRQNLTDIHEEAQRSHNNRFCINFDIKKQNKHL